MENYAWNISDQYNPFEKKCAKSTFLLIHSHFKIKSSSHAVRNIIPSNNGLDVEKKYHFPGYWIVLCLC